VLFFIAKTGEAGASPLQIKLFWYQRNLMRFIS